MTNRSFSTRDRFLAVCLAILGLSLLVGCGPVSQATPLAFQGNVQRGEYLSKVFTCQECHTPRRGDEEHLDRNRLFAGGVPFPGPDGSLIYSANVTLDNQYSDQTLDDLIRGRLAFKFAMPTYLINGMAADDMRDLIAYLKTLKPVLRPLPDPHLPPGFVLPAPTPAVPIPEHEPPTGTVERGNYLARMSGCRDCHSLSHTPGTSAGHHYFEGGMVPLGGGASFFAPNLTPDAGTGLGAWSDAEIIRAVRSGIAHDGRHLSPIMPAVIAYHDMTDQDASDLVRFLRSLKPAKATSRFSTH